MGCPPWVRANLGRFALVAILLATPARAAIIVTGETDDISFRASGNVSQLRPNSLLGTMGSSGDPSSRGLEYVFKLPTSDTGQTTVRSAEFRFTVTSTLAKPTTYNVDLYALPARILPTTLDTDYFIGALETITPPTGATTRIVDNLVLPDNVTTPKEVVVPFDTGTSFVDFLNTQYGPTGSGAGKYIFLRLNPDVLQLIAPDDTGWNANMAEATTGKPTLVVTFVPEPTLMLPAGVLLLTTLRRRRRRN